MSKLTMHSNLAKNGSGASLPKQRFELEHKAQLANHIWFKQLRHEFGSTQNPKTTPTGVIVNPPAGRKRHTNRRASVYQTRNFPNLIEQQRLLV